MTGEFIKPGTALLFMKVGTHAQEPLEEIIARKSKEIKDHGYAMWGYGGNTCHPSSMVRPFAEANNGIIKLCMEEMTSNHWAEPVRAEEYSPDGLEWSHIPEGINVRGSRYALVISELHEEKFDLPLSSTRVAVGPSEGRSGSRYIKGRVDKACLKIAEVAELANEPDEPTRPISLVADLRAPYAVFLRNR